MKHFRLIIFLVLLPLLPGCAGYGRTVGKVRLATEAGNVAEAITTLESSSLSSAKSDRLLYLLEKGMLLQLSGDFAGSNDTFDSAETHAEQLFGISVTNELKGALINDSGTDYEGEDFERVLIHYFRALNYLKLNNLDEAMVECRKADHFLSVVNERYSFKNVYKDDPLARYLSGILYEVDGSHNDAFIAYRKAYELYRGENAGIYSTPLPPFLLADLVRTAKKSGLRDEMEQYMKEAQCDLPPLPRGHGEIIVFFNNGWAPRKVKKETLVPVPSAVAVKLSVPEFTGVPPLVDHALVMIDDKEVGRTYVIENVSSIAAKNLQDRMGRVLVKTIARIAAKQIALEATLKGIESKKGFGAAAAARVIMQMGLNLTEQADIRSWTTLPYEVQLARIPLVSGEHRISLQLRQKNGELLETRDLGTIKLEPGKKEFISVRSYR